MLSDPKRIPNSSAINNVPDPTPLLSGFERSAVQANKVGLAIPVATPKNTAPAVYTNTDVQKATVVILIMRIIIPPISVLRRPILSEIPPPNARIKIVDKTYTPKNHPLFSIFKYIPISGVTTKIIPEDTADKNMTTAAGITLGSNASSHCIFSILQLNFWGLGKVSLNKAISTPENKHAAVAIMKSPLRPKSVLLVYPYIDLSRFQVR